LCGVCYDVCPVAIDIPSMLVHLRARVTESKKTTPESTAMRALAWAMSDARRWRRLVRLGRFGRLASRHVPLPGWSTARDLPQPPKETFRDWWESR
jgi:L-lactate dehydrogenase complex protein LldF